MTDPPRHVSVIGELSVRNRGCMLMTTRSIAYIYALLVNTEQYCRRSPCCIEHGHCGAIIQGPAVVVNIKAAGLNRLHLGRVGCSFRYGTGLGNRILQITSNLRNREEFALSWYPTKRRLHVKCRRIGERIGGQGGRGREGRGWRRGRRQQRW